ncbi:bifunctional MaoC family dehydratase N-terminal/OB-fold nucleic acid binding domain-containing protein [Nocardioides alcanivorans]|uniref:bifunctional MaoC family dehydratase N-terminal/OB-fold nucleic acid binding domain-containing protein n=1 Tax=Nocardioides alcanivorans TaxID=2897352 RepID=UPI001F16B329|nr:MaoC family dehydratase N-terminal domain-containing protein [Nocardioides alcanivorans]
MSASYEDRLNAFVGRVINALTPGQDPVNVPMIRHWVEALDLSNPVHLDAEAARATGRDDVVAPASMVQAWTMRGYAKSVRPSADAGSGAGFAELVDLLAEGGYTSVVATDSEFDFVREVVPGDEITVEEVVDSIGPEKETGLGTGRFVTTIKTYRDQAGETVATQRWRTLRFKPKAKAEPEAPKALRPRAAINLDNQFWFDAAKEHRLVIQRCASCQQLRHPVGPECSHCQSFEWDTVEASGRATLYSFTVAHHPKHPAFDYPLVIAVVELEEGTRLITNLVGIAPEDAEIGMALELEWLDADPDLTLPVFRAASAAGEEN